MTVWLGRKFAAGGATPGGVVIIPEGPVRARKSGDDGKPAMMTLTSVRFEGVLTVGEPDRFVEMIRGGIGSGKAFGFGLLSVARTG